MYFHDHGDNLQIAVLDKDLLSAKKEIWVYFWGFALFLVEEAPHKRIHLHHLLISDLFIQTVNDRDRQQQTGSADKADDTKHVRKNRQKTDEHSSDNSYTGNVSVQIAFKNGRRPPVAGDLHT